MVALRGPRTSGPMAPEISLEGQRPAEYVFSRHVENAMAKLKHDKPQARHAADAAD
jgi:hypothetical protein